jgi:F-type H+-transporting ATPase subunit b
MIDKRKRQFEESEAGIKRLRETVDQKMAAYEEKLRQAKVDAVEQKNEIIRQGAEEAKAIINAVRAEIPGMMEQFTARMEEEIDEARVLTNQSQKLSVEIAEKVLGRSLSMRTLLLIPFAFPLTAAHASGVANRFSQRASTGSIFSGDRSTSSPLPGSATGPGKKVKEFLPGGARDRHRMTDAVTARETARSSSRSTPQSWTRPRRNRSDRR